MASPTRRRPSLRIYLHAYDLQGCQIGDPLQAISGVLHASGSKTNLQHECRDTLLVRRDRVRRIESVYHIATRLFCKLRDQADQLLVRDRSFVLVDLQYLVFGVPLLIAPFVPCVIQPLSRALFC